MKEKRGRNGKREGGGTRKVDCFAFVGYVKTIMGVGGTGFQL